jgi:hypothetical protein
MKLLSLMTVLNVVFLYLLSVVLTEQEEVLSVDLYVAPNKDNKFIVSKEPFYWRILQEGSGYSLSRAEMSDAVRRVEIYLPKWF